METVVLIALGVIIGFLIAIGAMINAIIRGWR